MTLSRRRRHVLPATVRSGIIAVYYGFISDADVFFSEAEKYIAWRPILTPSRWPSSPLWLLDPPSQTIPMSWLVFNVVIQRLHRQNQCQRNRPFGIEGIRRQGG
jgi:hypothetical protein